MRLPPPLALIRALGLVKKVAAGVNRVQQLLGHADVSTTEIYARADAETKRKAIENAYEPLTPDALPDWTSDSAWLATEYVPPKSSQTTNPRIRNWGTRVIKVPLG